MLRAVSGVRLIAAPHMTGLKMAGQPPGAPAVWSRRRTAVTIIAVAAFVAAFWLADHVLGQYRWADVVAQLGGIPRHALLAALLLTIGSYLTLTFYDGLALRYAGARLGWPKTAIASFCAFAVGHSIGFVALSGGSIRYRVYSSAGLSAGQIAQVVVFSTLTFFLGGTLLLDV